MISSRQAAVAAASLLSAIIALPPAVLAETTRLRPATRTTATIRSITTNRARTSTARGKNTARRRVRPGQPRGGNPAFNNNKQGPSGRRTPAPNSTA